MDYLSMMVPGMCCLVVDLLIEREVDPCRLSNRIPSICRQIRQMGHLFDQLRISLELILRTTYAP